MRWMLCGVLALGLGLAAVAQEKPAEEKPTPEETASIGKLKEAGGLVLEIAQNDKRLDIGLHLATAKVTDAHLEQVKALGPKVAILNLRGTEVTDAGLAHLAGLTGLVKLHLEKTKVTDAGLEHLKGLENLESLNLYGTEVTDAGLAHLEGLKKLKKLYLWQTKVTDEGVNKLKTAVPTVDIVRGLDQPVKVAAPDNTPPEGFVALFNGKDLTGWKGLLKSPLDNPFKRAAATPEELAAAQAEANKLMTEHWKVENGALVYDGMGSSLAAEKDYGDFEMYVDWKILAKGDSGIYVRGTPQIQIWDPADHPEGSGGLYNNATNPNKPSKAADKPIGEWNTFWIKMVGDKVSVKLNGELVVDNVTLENYWDRKEKPDQALPATGQIELQHHGNRLEFKNIYIKELPKP